MTTRICFTCRAQFERYRISSRRAANPQFCSRECRAVEDGKRALARLGNRFWANVDVQDNAVCWLWNGRRDPNGYGRLDYKGRPQLAHRFAFIFQHGHINNYKTFVCHRCDNPPCCNPHHLFLGTHKDNMADMASKGRRSVPSTRRGESSNKAKLTANQAVAVFKATGSHRNIGNQYGISSTAVRLIKIGRNWAHVTGAA